MIAPFFFLPSILEEESKDIFLQDVKFDIGFCKVCKTRIFLYNNRLEAFYLRQRHDKETVEI